MSLPAEITGREPLADDGSPLDALIGFYRAFNASDMNALAANWADGDAPSMDNPIGGTRRGWPAIRDGYAKLFSGPATVRVAFHDFAAQGSCETPSVRIGLRIRTSRWFVKMRGVWRQLHHHGSIDEPGMLADYQRVILGAPLGATS
jgi:SnoaL-like domain